MKHVAAALASFALIPLSAAGCPGHVARWDDDADTDGSDSDAGSTTHSTGDDSNDDVGVALRVNKDVDILFVIDNSGSMGAEQRNLSQSFSAFLDVLEAPDVRANYRIAFTTTDNGNPWCTGTGPEGGALVLSSCRQRVQDFTFGTGPNAKDQTAACNDFCPEELTFIAVKPTVTQYDDVARPRRWIESIDGVTNLPDGISSSQAMSCFGPQGVNGCGFESHLESMYKALTRASRDEEVSYGFVRDNAILAIVIVTDEVDCSYNTEWDEIFARDGNKVFWSLPDASNPTSAVCWNAGVECTGGPGTYDECHAANFDVNGNVLPDDRANADAVLRPVSRYTSYVQSIENAKKSYDADQEVLVALFAGVPTNYPTEPLRYQDTPGGTPGDPNYQTNFGIGPGCSSQNGEAVPPVREREFAEFFAVPDANGNDNNLYSICAGDFSAALAAIAYRIRDRIRPLCMPACVEDSDRTTPNVLDERCTLTKRVTFADATHRDFVIPKCLGDEGSIPDGQSSCYVAIDVIHDPDAASRDCIDDGYNLEFKVFDRPNSDQGISSVIIPKCELSTQKRYDCPGLVG